MRTLKQLVGFVLVIGLVVFFAHAEDKVANDPQSDAGKLVMVTIDKVRSTVSAKKGKVTTEELDKSLSDVILPVFDFAEMAKQCLGTNWNVATEDERKQFVDLFSELLSHTYLSKVRKVDQTTSKFVAEAVQGQKALVRTVLNDKGDDIEMNYRLYHTGDQWRVYDIVIENISLASNYRSEFAGIVRKDKMTGLIEKLKEKQTNRKADEAAKGA